jgi:(2Fe-2S) ferredoxin
MGKDMRRVKNVIYFCAGGPCTQKGSGLLIRETRALLKTEGLQAATHTVKTLCAGHCEHGPIVAVQPDNVWYREMDVEKSDRMIRDHIMEGRPVEAWLLHSSDGGIGEKSSVHGIGKSRVFESRQLPEWGEVKAASMEPWEINLHPLMKDLFVNRYQGLEFKVHGIDGGPFSLNQPAVLQYDGGCADLKTLVHRFSLVIGLFKEADPEYPRLWRDRITELLFIESQGGGGVPGRRALLATSRSGVRALEVRFPQPGSVPGPDPWDHYTRIYLERI